MGVDAALANVTYLALRGRSAYTAHISCVFEVTCSLRLCMFLVCYYMLKVLKFHYHGQGLRLYSLYLYMYCYNTAQVSSFTSIDFVPRFDLPRALV